MRAAPGPEVAAHGAYFFEVEQEARGAAVTGWERKRYFEQI